MRYACLLFEFAVRLKITLVNILLKILTNIVIHYLFLFEARKSKV